MKSLIRLCCLVTLLVGGTAAAVVSYVDSRRPVPREPVAVDHEAGDAEVPALPSEVAKDSPT